MKKILLPLLLLVGCGVSSIAHADEASDIQALKEKQETISAQLSEAQVSLSLADASLENTNQKMATLQEDMKRKPKTMKEKMQYQTKKVQLTSLMNESNKIQTARDIRAKRVTDLQSEKDALETQVQTLTKQKEEKEAKANQATATNQAINQTRVDTPSTPAPQVSTNGEWVDGLRPQTAQARDHLASIFPVTIGGYRPGDSDGVGTGHGDGLALDLMVPVSSSLGDSIAQYVIDHYSELHVSYIIWKQRFWAPYPNIYGSANTWSWMPNRGSITQNHYDHVHVSFAR